MLLLTMMMMMIMSLTMVIVHPTSTVTLHDAPPQLNGDYRRHLVARVGTTLRLACPVDARGPTALVEWWKDGHRVHDGWVRHRSVNATLRVRDLRLSDSGRYRCEVTNGFGSARAIFLLHVYDVAALFNTRSATPAANDSQSTSGSAIHTATAPVFTRPDSMRSSRQVSLVVGDSARLRCEARGSPAPEVVWYKDDTVLDGAGQRVTWSLRLDHVTVQDAGMYTCVVYNHVGTISFSYNVTIRKILNQSTSTSSEYVAVAGGRTVKLTCPAPSLSGRKQTVEWMKLRSADDDVTNVTSRQVSGGSRRLTEADDAGRRSTDPADRYFSVLTIDNATRRDAGLFVCYYITSTHRSAFHVFRLIVTDDKPNTEDSSKMPTRDVRNSPLTALTVTMSIVVFTVTALLTVFCVVTRRHRSKTTQPLKPTPRHLATGPGTTTLSGYSPAAGYLRCPHTEVRPGPASFHQSVCSDTVYPTVKSSWASTAVPLSELWSASQIGSRHAPAFTSRQIQPITLHFYNDF